MDQLRKDVALEKQKYKAKLEKNLIERAKLLNKAKTDEVFQRMLLKKCEDDILFWFEYFAFTQNIKGFSHLTGEAIPFLLFLFQKEFVIGLWQNIMDASKPIDERIRALDVFVEKSRQVGITWIVDAVFTY